MTLFKAERAKRTAGSSKMPVAPAAMYIIRAPPYLGVDVMKPAHQTLVTNPHHRNKHGFFFDWHQQEFPSCPSEDRGAHYVQVPQVWQGVEILFGAVADLRLVHC